VGLAVYEHIAGDLRVHEFAVDLQASCRPEAAALALVHALDLAGIAGAERRIIVTPRAAPFAATFRDCGYDVADEGCAGRWLQKPLLTSAFDLPSARR
jgi:hypothetical protein